MVTPGKTGGVSDALAKTISVLMHPMLAPVWAVAAILAWGMLPYASVQAKAYLAGVVILDTVIVPAICTLIISRMKPLHEDEGNRLRERILPMTVMIVCYLACLYLLKDFPYGTIVRKTLLAGVACLTVAAAVTFFWKISLHMIAAGAVTAILGTFLFLAPAHGLLPALCVWVALSGALASARLRLGAHDAAQVAAGYFTGLAVAAAVLAVF